MFSFWCFGERNQWQVCAFHLGNLVVGSRSPGERNVFLSMVAHHLSIFFLDWPQNFPKISLYTAYMHIRCPILCFDHGFKTILVLFLCAAGILAATKSCSSQRIVLTPATSVLPIITAPYFAPKTGSERRASKDRNVAPTGISFNNKKLWKPGYFPVKKVWAYLTFLLIFL